MYKLKPAFEGNCAHFFSNGFLHLLSPWRVFTAVLLKMMLDRCIKRQIKGSRGRDGNFENFEQGPQFQKIVFPPTSSFELKLKIDNNYKNV
jgi:hypothetical protein